MKHWWGQTSGQRAELRRCSPGYQKEMPNREKIERKETGTGQLGQQWHTHGHDTAALEEVSLLSVLWTCHLSLNAHSLSCSILHWRCYSQSCLSCLLHFLTPRSVQRSEKSVQWAVFICNYKWEETWLYLRTPAQQDYFKYGASSLMSRAIFSQARSYYCWY